MNHFFLISILFQVFFKILMFYFTKGEKFILNQILAENFFLQNLIFYHQFECINFYSAGLQKISFIVTPLFKDGNLKYYLFLEFYKYVFFIYLNRLKSYLVIIKRLYKYDQFLKDTFSSI